MKQLNAIFRVNKSRKRKIQKYILKKMSRLHKKLHRALDEKTLGALRAISVNTVLDFLQQDPGKLEKLTNIPRKDVQEIKDLITQSFSGKIQSGKELLQCEEDNNVISTGISRLDELLDGGLHPGEIYEFCGMPSAGKTQLSMNLAVNVIIETDGVVRYIDTKNDFSCRKIQMILEGQGYDDEKMARIMSKLKITRVKNIYELMSVLYDLTNDIKVDTVRAGEENDKSSPRLVIIDSLPSLILPTTEKSSTHRFLNHIAAVGKYLVNCYAMSMITINLVTQWRECDTFVSSKREEQLPLVRPMLGKFWLQAPNCRLLVEKLASEERRITVWKSSSLKNNTSCVINLTDAGFI